MKFTNTQPGPRGVNAINGPVLIDPKQTVDNIEVYEREKAHIDMSGWFTVEGSYTANPPVTGAAAAATGDTSEIDRLKAELAAKDDEIALLKKPADDAPKGAYAVTEKSPGWFAITQGDKEVTKSLRKDDVKDFDGLSDADKVAFVDLHKPE